LSSERTGEFSAKPTIDEPVDDDRYSAPGGSYAVDDFAGACGLAARLNPVVDEKHALARLQVVSPSPQAKVAVSVVRWRMGYEPAIAVGSRARILA
jgi:hypothetical protein